MVQIKEHVADQRTCCKSKQLGIHIMTLAMNDYNQMRLLIYTCILYAKGYRILYAKEFQNFPVSRQYLK